MLLIHTHHFHFALRILLKIGALIMTAVAVQDVYATLAVFGIGLDFALGAGVVMWRQTR